MTHLPLQDSLGWGRAVSLLWTISSHSKGPLGCARGQIPAEFLLPLAPSQKTQPNSRRFGLWAKESNGFLCPASEHSQLFHFPWNHLASSSLPSPCQQLLLLNETNSWPGRSSRFVIVGPSDIFIFPHQWHLFQAIHIPRAFVILITSRGKQGILSKENKTLARF